MNIQNAPVRTTHVDITLEFLTMQYEYFDCGSRLLYQVDWAEALDKITTTNILKIFKWNILARYENP